MPEEWVLREASRLITTDRNGDYGPAVEDFSVIAEYWNTYLQSIGMRVFITAKDVALMMTLLKIRREATHPKRDNVVDGCGYLALAQKCEEESTIPGLEEQARDELSELAHVWPCDCGFLPNTIKYCAKCGGNNEERDETE
jgi:hypothetical protein